MEWIMATAGALLLIALAYWQLVLAEGAYLGPRVVALLYDWSARRYDRLKGYEPSVEHATVGRPLSLRVGDSPCAVVLDVATGTGRLLMSLLPQTGFRGSVVGLDLSPRMLERASENLAPYSDRVRLILQDATRLPFAEAVFDAVTCLEALEFLPHPIGTLREMVRVLKPGGTLLFTNRVGWEAWFLPGRRFSRGALNQVLATLPLTHVQIMPWEVNYDQIWAVRQSSGEGPP